MTIGELEFHVHRQKHHSENSIDETFRFLNTIDASYRKEYFVRLPSVISVLLLSACATAPASSDYESRKQTENTERGDNFKRDVEAIATGNTFVLIGGAGSTCDGMSQYFLEPLKFKSAEVTDTGMFGTRKINFHFSKKDGQEALVNSNEAYPTDDAEHVMRNCFMKVEKKTNLKFSKKDKELIKKGSARIGFTKDQAILSLGHPDDINRTVTGNHVSEQWVYRDHFYLYFENGLLTSFQD